MHDRKHAILQEALRHVPFDGWTESVLTNAVKATGLDAGYAAILFPEGVAGLVDMFIADADQRMIAAVEELPLKDMKIRERITMAIRVRLEQNTQYRPAIQRAIAFYAMPQHAIRAAASVWRTANFIWYTAGDTATDYNHYTKRMLLGGVYSTTLLYWLDDHSEKFQATHEFLDRRIADIMKIGNVRKLGSNINETMRRIPFVRLAFMR